MVDVVSESKRSQMMSRISGKNTRPEMLVRKALFAMGYRFRIHRHDLPGTPDIVMSSRKIAIFVHGCFWHAHRGCKYAKTPATRTEFWTTKLRASVDRDARAVRDLGKMGWRVLTVWECSTRKPTTPAGLAEALRGWIERGSSFGEISSQSCLAISRAEAVAPS